MYQSSIIKMEIKELRDYIEKQTWTFAKTYANKAPHEYIVRGKSAGTVDEFMCVINYIYRTVI